VKKEINLLVSNNEILSRKKKIKKYLGKTNNGALTKYAKLVSQANTGATTT
jgi:dihydroxyacid dehydratase/phosphogluconate dehydratase